MAAASGLLTKYLAVEEQFAGKVLDEAMVGLVKVSQPHALLHTYIAHACMGSVRPSTPTDRPRPRMHTYTPPIAPETKQANKDSLATVLALATAHRELPRRNKMVAALVRQLGSLNERAAGADMDGLIGLLERATKLPGKGYGEVSIAAAQALLSLKTPPFETRKARGSPPSLHAYMPACTHAPPSLPLLPTHTPILTPPSPPPPPNKTNT